MENATIKMGDLHREIKADIERLLDLKKEILWTINKLNDVSQQLILEMKYINGKSWEDVARNLGFDHRWILRLHGKALKEIDEIRNTPLKATFNLWYNIKCQGIEKSRTPHAVWIRPRDRSLRLPGNAAFLKALEANRGFFYICEFGLFEVKNSKGCYRSPWKDYASVKVYG